MRQLVLRSHQSPGDILMLTAAVRDLHRRLKGDVAIDVRTSAPDLWLNNPYLTKLDEKSPGVQSIDMHYPLVHESNQRPYHFIHGYPQYLGQVLELDIPVTEFRGDVHLSPAERDRSTLTFPELPDRYWILMAGGKYDFTAKWWNPVSYQRVVDHFRDRVTFVQCGATEHWHPPLTGTVNLIGRTDLRQFVQLMYWADGVVCPVTFAMHLAAAVDVPPGRPPGRACVVIAGGREPPHWEAYPHHQFLSTVGTLDCCATGGCWKSRCQQVGDGDSKDRRGLCEQPVQVADNLRIPRCLEMIRPEDVIQRIEWVLAGRQQQNSDARTNGHHAVPPPAARRTTSARIHVPKPKSSPLVGLRYYAGWERATSIPTLIAHLRHYFPGHAVAIAADNETQAVLGRLSLDATLGQHSSAWETSGRWFDIGTDAPRVDFRCCPSTTTSSLLLHAIGVSPIGELFAPPPTSPDRAARRSPESDTILVHLERTEQESAVWRSLETDPNLQSCKYLRVELEPGSRSPGLFERGKHGWRNIGPVSPEALLKRIAGCRLFLGYDSRLTAWAALLAPQAVALWDQRHPAHWVDPSPRVEHLLVAGRSDVVSSPAAQRYFHQHYRARECFDLVEGLSQYLSRQEPAPVPSNGRKSRRSSPLRPAKRTTVPPRSPTSRTRAPVSLATVPNPSVPVASPETVPAAPVSTPSLPLPRPRAQQVALRFFHGLGDAAFFARLIPLYVRRGFEISVDCTPDKSILFRAAGATLCRGAELTHDWGYPPENVTPRHEGLHLGSKPGWNLSQPPLPDIGSRDALWPEYCASEARATALIGDEQREHVRGWLHGAPRPWVLLHSKGNTAQGRKSLPDKTAAEFYLEFLDRCEGTLILLDWDDRVPRLNSFRVRHLATMPRGCPTERLLALMELSDLMIGVDSGPLHVAALTDIPRIGVWMPGHYPARYSLPDRRQLNLVLSAGTEELNRYYRVPWNIVTQPGREFDPGWLAEQVRRVQSPPAYLTADQSAIDVQLQQWIGEYCRGSRRNLEAIHQDRNRSFDRLLRLATERFSRPTIVETGTMRAEEDWSGAGFSTYLFGRYAAARGGTLHTVDLSIPNTEFARRWCGVFGQHVQVHCRDSVQFLRTFESPVDVLYLDSLDTYEPGHAQHALHEAQAALPRLHAHSLILIDDTPFGGNSFSGKGALAVPWLQEQGWKIVYAGSQVLLSREGAP
jgi:ADP-heptose:LPS heptosyltransferase